MWQFTFFGNGGINLQIFRFKNGNYKIYRHRIQLWGGKNVLLIILMMGGSMYVYT
jgi:hypothetical protein